MNNSTSNFLSIFRYKKTTAKNLVKFIEDNPEAFNEKFLASFLTYPYSKAYSHVAFINKNTKILEKKIIQSKCVEVNEDLLSEYTEIVSNFRIITSKPAIADPSWGLSIWLQEEELRVYVLNELKEFSKKLNGIERDLIKNGLLHRLKV